MQPEKHLRVLQDIVGILYVTRFHDLRAAASCHGVAWLRGDGSSLEQSRVIYNHEWSTWNHELRAEAKFAKTKTGHSEPCLPS